VINTFSGDLDRMKTMTALANDYLLKDFVDKLYDPHFRYKAKFWQPKAQKIDSLTQLSYQYFEKLKQQLLEETGVTSVNMLLGKTDYQTVRRFFFEKNKANELYDALSAYKRIVIEGDSIIFTHFNHRLYSTSPVFDISGVDKQTFASFFLKDISVFEAMIVLNQWQNNLLLAENALLNFINEQVPDSWCGFYKYSPIISQNATYVKGGESIEITAGVGAFIVSIARARITINGKKIELGVDGQAHYKFRAQKKNGAYSIPIKIEYDDGFDNLETEVSSVKYTVRD
jgi:hypothetical protein